MKDEKLLNIYATYEILFYYLKMPLGRLLPAGCCLSALLPLLCCEGRAGETFRICTYIMKNDRQNKQVFTLLDVM